MYLELKPRALLATLIALHLGLISAQAEHRNTLESTNAEGGGSSMASSGAVLKLGGAKRGDGAMYQKNPLTTELAKSADKYESQINDATKSALSTDKESTNSFISSIGDKLKVPETSDTLLKQISSEADTFNHDNGAKNTLSLVDDIIAGTKSDADVQVETIKTLALKEAPNGPGLPQPKAPLPTIGELLKAYKDGADKNKNIGNPLDYAMGVTPSGKKSVPPSIDGGSATASAAGPAPKHSRGIMRDPAASGQ